MREQLESRLAELQREYETGQRVGVDMAARQDELRQSMLRIGGAIQVLQELLATPDGSLTLASAGDAPPRRTAVG